MIPIKNPSLVVQVAILFTLCVISFQLGSSAKPGPDASLIPTAQAADRIPSGHSPDAVLIAGKLDQIESSVRLIAKVINDKR